MQRMGITKISLYPSKAVWFSISEILGNSLDKIIIIEMYLFENKYYTNHWHKLAVLFLLIAERRVLPTLSKQYTPSNFTNMAL